MKYIKIGIPRYAFLAALLLANPLLSQTPAIVQGGVLNAADGSRDLAPGSLVSIFGSNLAPATSVAAVVPLPATLDGVSVEVVDAGKTLPAALWFVSVGQINAQLPFGLSGGAIQLRVKTKSGTSNSETVPVAARAPRLFTKSMTGKGEPLLIHADYTLVSEQSPAIPGEAVFVYVNGMGDVTPAMNAGQAGGDGTKAPLNRTSQAATVTVGGRPAEVYFAGMAPNFVVYQVNFQIPIDAPAGPQPVLISMGQYASQAGVAAAVGRKLQPIAAGTIGTAGGEIGAAGTATLKIPGGAFAGAAAVSLSKASTFSSATANENTDILIVNGLPDTWSAPLTISLEMPANIAGKLEPLIMMQSKTRPEGTGMQILDATVNGKVITAIVPRVEELTPADAFKDAARFAHNPEAVFEPSGPEISFYMMTYYTRIKSPSGKFMIFYSPDWKGLDAKAQRAGEILDEAYKKLETFGLSWAQRTREIRVVLYPYPQDKIDRWGEAEPSRLGSNYYSLSLNSIKLLSATDETEMRATIAHELFHVMQALYDPRGALRSALYSGTWLWYLEASATWFESVFLGNENYVPGQVSGSNYTFLTQRGLEFPPGDDPDVQSHGYGASLFLRYLAKSGNSVIGSILKRGAMRMPGLIANPQYSPVEAIDFEASGIGSSWRGFVRDYVSRKLTPAGYPSLNEIYGQLGGRCALTAVASCPVIAWAAPDLSARFVAVDLDRGWGDKTALTFEMDDSGGAAEAIVYKTSGNWDIIGSFRNGKFEIPSAEKVAAESPRLLLVLVNARAVRPYSGTSGIAVRIGAQTALPQYTVVEGNIPAVKCQSTRYNSNPPTTGTGICQDLKISNWYNSTALSGLVPLTWSGTSFSAAGSLTQAGYSCEVSVSGQLSADTKSVASAKFSRKCKNILANKSWGETELVYTITDLPNSGSNNNFELSAEAARQHVAITKYSDVYWNADGSKNQEVVMTGPLEGTWKASVIFH